MKLLFPQIRAPLNRSITLTRSPSFFIQNKTFLSDAALLRFYPKFFRQSIWDPIPHDFTCYSETAKRTYPHLLQPGAVVYTAPFSAPVILTSRVLGFGAIAAGVDLPILFYYMETSISLLSKFLICGALGSLVLIPVIAGYLYCSPYAVYARLTLSDDGLNRLSFIENSSTFLQDKNITELEIFQMSSEKVEELITEYYAKAGTGEYKNESGTSSTPKREIDLKTDNFFGQELVTPEMILAQNYDKSLICLEMVTMDPIGRYSFHKGPYEQYKYVSKEEGYPSIWESPSGKQFALHNEILEAQLPIWVWDAIKPKVETKPLEEGDEEYIEYSGETLEKE